MVVSRALRATGCTSCRLHLLRSFASLAVSQNSAQGLGRFPKSTTPRLQHRSSSQLVPDGLGKNAINFDRAEEKAEDEVFDEELQELNERSDQEQLSTLPWYLQVESPQRAPQPLSERQKIPDLPELPPPILQPLLQQISVNLGLDDLSLLDLRKLDPPPALGANLLMIIGTARSEKHLHVSADRLCRWLRSNYKLRPDADGLLGRNELKLKLRRKAKRAKLLGNSADDNGDDGVRTGWVCVDVGVVDGVERIPEETNQKQDFVGFGRRTDGVRIVVQMLTEEKREQIDLEKLWTGILRRAETPAIETEEGDSEFLFPDEVAYPDSYSDPREKFKYLPQVPGQIRALHTSARRQVSYSDLESAADPSISTRHILEASRFQELDLQGVKGAATQAIASEDFGKAKSVLLEHSTRIHTLQNDGWQSFLLDLLVKHLETMPKDYAIKALGFGDLDRGSTPFLACFYDTLSLFPTAAEAEARIWLNDYAVDIGHTGYTTEYFPVLLAELQENAVEIPQSAFMRVLRRVLGQEKPDPSPNFRWVSPQQKIITSRQPSKEGLDAATKIIRSMQSQGLEVLTEDMLVFLQETTSRTDPASTEGDHLTTIQNESAEGPIYTDLQATFDLPSVPMSPVQRRLHAVIRHVDLPLFSDESRMRLLALYSRLGYWVQFWEVFRMASTRGEPQSADMYAFMFTVVAETQNQKACIAVLRTWVAELEKEQPPIALRGDVGAAVKACIEIADPLAKQEFAADPDWQGEFVDILRRCEWAGGQNDPFMYD